MNLVFYLSKLLLFDLLEFIFLLFLMLLFLIFRAIGSAVFELMGVVVVLDSLHLLHQLVL